MSATRDKTQKVAFVYSNLYQIYKNGKEAAHDAPFATAQAAPAPAAQVAPAPLMTAGAAPMAHKSAVIKADDLHRGNTAEVKQFVPADFIGKRIPKPEVLVRAESNAALESLKKNLNDLNDLHARLRFMLKELEDLVRE